MCSVILLSDTLAQNILQIVVPERLFKLRFSRRIDAFADKHGILIDNDRLRIGRNYGIVLFLRHAGRMVLTEFNGLFYMLWSCSAAAAHDTGSHLHDLSHGPGKLIRIDIIDRLSAFAPRKSGVWIYNDRN